MTKIKYTGTGLSSEGFKFSPTTNGGLYDVEDEHATYLLKTFPRQFTLIEPPKVKEKTPTAPKKQATRKPRKKSTDIVE